MSEVLYLCDPDVASFGAYMHESSLALHSVGGKGEISDNENTHTISRVNLSKH